MSLRATLRNYLIAGALALPGLHGIRGAGTSRPGDFGQHRSADIAHL